MAKEITPQVTTCDICRFWVHATAQPRNGEVLGEDDGECRRRSPQGGSLQAYFCKAKGEKPNSMIAVAYPFPVTHAKDWCAEFEPPPAVF